MLVRILTHLALIALPLAALPLIAAPVAAQTPNPAPSSPRLARLVPPSPMPASYIADGPHVLSAEAREQLDLRITALQDSGLADIGIAILPSIGDFQPYEVGVAIYRSWGIGRRDSIGSARRDLGVLLLVVPREVAPDSVGHCWITTGLGAEGIITDAEGGEICRERIIPRLRERDHAGALAAGIEGIADHMRREAGLAARPAVSAEQRSVRRTRNALASALALGGTIVGLALLAFALWWRRHGPRKCAKCGQRMHRLAEDRDDAALGEGQQLEERLGSVDYDVWRCQCGEELVRPHKAIFSRHHACPACGVRAARTTRRIVSRPTYISTGLAEDTEHCEHCKRTDVKQVVLARRTPPSEGGSSGGRHSGGRSGGGGRSFGGSGRTSGGGGGGRY
jgi:uncharacterized protein